MYLDGQGQIGRRGESGVAMAALLVALSVLAVMLTVALPVWKTTVKREREAELIWRGQQYARAIQLFQRKYANAFPPNLDILLNERFLRKKYKDPMTKDGEFQLIPAAGQGAPGTPGAPGGPGAPGAPGAVGTVPQQGQPGGRPASGLDGGTRGPAGAQGGILGVVSKSTETSIRLYLGRGKYNEWAFTAQQASQRIGAPAGSGRPGMPNPQGGPPRPGATGPGGRPGAQQPGAPPGQQPPPFGLPRRPPI